MERMLKLAQVEEIVARKRTWIYGEVAAGRFPPPDDGLWYAAEINRYIRLRCEGKPLDGIWTDRIAEVELLHRDLNPIPCNHPRRDEPTCLYRHRDASGTLLYVGISLSCVQRLGQHRAATWIRDVARIDVEWFHNRTEALRAERIAIAKERPVHNQVHALRSRSR